MEIEIIDLTEKEFDAEAKNVNSLQERESLRVHAVLNRG